MHGLLARQIKRHLGSSSVDPEDLAAFLDAVDQAYNEFDTDRGMLERSMELSSRELLQANSEMRAVLKAVPDIFLKIDEDGLIVSVHAGDSDDLYMDANELLHRRIDDVPDPELASAFRNAVREAAETGATVSIDYEMKLRGRALVYEARILPLVGGQALVIIRNVTDRRRVEVAEAANRAKSEFLANLSHELRTPLHGILSFARFGAKRRDTADREKLGEYFSRVIDSGQLLLSLLNDLLDLAKLESGKITLDAVPTDLLAIVSRVQEQFSSISSERNLVIELSSSAAEAVVPVDPSMIEQVVRNLLSNAVRYSPEGSIVRIEVEAAVESVTVRVLDEGKGIPEEELESIFDKFVQSSFTKTGAGGTGLGLAISREIITAHGGRLWAANRAEGGAELSFELPIQRPAPPVESEPLTTEAC
jgi:signal transduction histidine kinase